MKTTYGPLLRRRDVLVVLVPYVLARIPMSMMTLALLLAVRAQTASFARAGVVAAAYGLAGAVGSPVLGRLVDRRGPRLVLPAAGIAHVTAMVVLAGTLRTTGGAVVVAAAAAGGMSLPPLSGCMRTLWTRLLDGDAERNAAFAVEGVVVELAELAAPVLVGLATTLGHPRAAVVAGASVTGLAACAFSVAAGRSWPAAEATADSGGALRIPAVRRLLMLVLLLTSTIGAVEVAVTVYARLAGSAAAAGPLIALASVGGIAAGAAYGRVRSAWSPRRALPVLLVATAAASAALGVHVRWVVLPTLLVYGGVVAVAVVVLTGAIAAAAPEGTRTEAFTWASTANFVGVSAGTASAGWIADRYGLVVAAATAAAPALLAAGAALRLRPEPATAVEDPVVTRLREVVDEMTAELAATRAALREALGEQPHVAVVRAAEERAAAMLERADADCARLRERAEDDAARVREAATAAALEVLRAAERDASAILDRARRHADRIEPASSAAPVVDVA